LKGTWDADRDPLVALARGDPAPFEQFVRTEIGTFLGFFQRLGADRGEAEDLAQEVFLKLFRSAPTYAPQQRFSSFALRVARNAWIDRRRRRAARPVDGTLDGGADDAKEGALIERLPAPGREVASLASSAEEGRRLAAAIRTLPESHRVVFELAVVQSLPYADISSTLGIPVGTVKSRVFNALRKLRDVLGDATEGGR
jgi:RNA polymerase sigma-70 factor (ECF subfamily)